MNISQTLKILERKKFIVRTHNTLDSRARSVFLTEIRRDIIKTAIKQMEESERNFLESWSVISVDL